MENARAMPRMLLLAAILSSAACLANAEAGTTYKYTISSLSMLAVLNQDGSMDYSETLTLFSKDVDLGDANTTTLFYSTGLPREADISMNSVRIRDILTGKELTRVDFFEDSLSCANQFVFNQTSNLASLCLPAEKQIRLEVRALILPLTDENRLIDDDSRLVLGNRLFLAVPGQGLAYDFSFSVEPGEGVEISDYDPGFCDFNQTNVELRKFPGPDHGIVCSGTVQPSSAPFFPAFVVFGYDTEAVDEKGQGWDWMRQNGVSLCGLCLAMVTTFTAVASAAYPSYSVWRKKGSKKKSSGLGRLFFGALDRSGAFAFNLKNSLLSGFGKRRPKG